MSQPNFPPARLFDAFAKPASTEQPAKKGLLGKLGLGEPSEEDNYTTVMLVGFNSAKEPPGNGSFDILAFKFKISKRISR